MHFHRPMIDARGSAWLLCREAEKASAPYHVLNNFYSLLTSFKSGVLKSYNPATSCSLMPESHVWDVHVAIEAQLAESYPRVSQEKAIKSLTEYLRARALRKVNPNKGRALKFIQGLTRRFANA